MLRIVRVFRAQSEKPSQKMNTYHAAEGPIAYREEADVHKCVTPKKLFEKGGLEGLRPSKFPLFWRVAATNVAATRQKGSARGIAPRAPPFQTGSKEIRGGFAVPKPPPNRKPCMAAKRKLGTTSVKGSQMQPIQLSLTLEETNMVLEALGQLPYIKVYQLIGKIQQQAQEQLQTSQADKEGSP